VCSPRGVAFHRQGQKERRREKNLGPKKTKMRGGHGGYGSKRQYWQRQPENLIVANQNTETRGRPRLEPPKGIISRTKKTKGKGEETNIQNGRY